MATQSKTQDLEAFVAVVDSGSFSAAAKNLGQQVAKVSRAVSRLESTLQCTLLNRTTRRLELTEEGEVFIGYVRQGLNALESAEEALQLLHAKPAGKLRIDAASPFMLHQLVEHIGEFTQCYPEIKLELTSNDNIIDLLEHKTDIAIRIGSLADSNLHAKLLGHSKLHLVASTQYLAEHGTPEDITELNKHRLLGFTDSPKLNHWPLIEQQDLNFSLMVSSGETMRQLALHGQGIALLSNFMVAKDIANGQLHSLLQEQIQSPNRREPVQAVYYKNSAVSSRISAFLDFIATRLQL